MFLNSAYTGRRLQILSYHLQLLHKILQWILEIKEGYLIFIKQEYLKNF
jgi:hypothetical protein